MQHLSARVSGVISVSARSMEAVGVLLTCPMNSYLEQELDRRYRLFRLWDTAPESRADFLRAHAPFIRALVGNAHAGADAETIDLLPRLEIVSSFSVGLDKVDLDKCRQRGIRVTNTLDVLTEDVADLTIGLAIATLRRICECDRYVRSGSWTKMGDYKLTTKVGGKTVGIVGLGRIGSAIARRAEAFGCSITYHSRSVKPHVDYKYFMDILDLALNSQILVIACPLTAETFHIIDRKVIDALGPKGVLINVGRGVLLDEQELVLALLEGRLGGAGLDVFEHEPEPPEQLYQLENVVLLPHVGSDTHETCLAMADLVLGNLEAHFLNKPLLTPVV